MSMTRGVIQGDVSIAYLGCYWRPSSAYRAAQAISVFRLHFPEGAEDGAIELYPEPVFRPIPAGGADDAALLADGYTWHPVTHPGCEKCLGAGIADVHKEWRQYRRWASIRALARRLEKA